MSSSVIYVVSTFSVTSAMQMDQITFMRTYLLIIFVFGFYIENIASFFRDYTSLRVHFKSDHYLCEDGDCANEQFTAVFRSDIDLKG